MALTANTCMGKGTPSVLLGAASLFVSEPSTATCDGLGRWEFLCLIAPLRIPGGTGSPVNPIAIF